MYGCPVKAEAGSGDGRSVCSLRYLASASAELDDMGGRIWCSCGHMQSERASRHAVVCERQSIHG